MSALLLFVITITIAVLCFTAEFAIYVVQIWNRRTELSSRLQHLLFHPVLSAVLIILATLLFVYAGNEAAVPILLVSLCAVGSISQGLHLSASYRGFRSGSTSWVVVVGPIFICFVIQLGLSVATGFLVPNTEPQKIIDIVLLSVFLVEYFLMVLIYLIIYGTRAPPLSSNSALSTRVPPLSPNSKLVWNTTICSIITVAALISLALYYHCIVDRTTCLLILVSATLTRTLRPIWVTLEPIWLTLKRSTQKRNKMFAVPSVAGSNEAFSA